MSDYTPTTGHVRRNYVFAESFYSVVLSARVTRQDEFDRWLETVRAEAKAEALREAADAWGAGEWQEAWLADAVEDDVSAVRSTVTWLRDRADRSEAGSDDA